VKRKANETEKKLAKSLGASRRPCSGAILGQKGDIVDSDFLYDSKETKNNSISIKKEDWMKISREAYGDKKYPALIISIRDESWVMMPIEVFKEIKDGNQG